MRRREFLKVLGTISGSLLLPTPIARQIRESCILNKKPLLILPPDAKVEILAVHDGWDYTLHIGDPDELLVTPSWAEWFEEQGIDVNDPEVVAEQLGCTPDEVEGQDLDTEIDSYAYDDWLSLRQQSPEYDSRAGAYEFLSDLPLCNSAKSHTGDALGALNFVDGDRPGSSLLYVEAPSLASLAGLQHRLNELQTGARIVIAGTVSGG